MAAVAPHAGTARVASASARPLRDRLALTAGLVAPFLVALALVPFRTDLSHVNAALILVVVVVAVAARPYETFDITASADIETAVLLLLVGVIVSQLAARARRLEVITVMDAAHLSRIHRTADLARSAGSADTVVDHVRRELTDLLGLRACRFEYGTLMGRPPRLQNDGSVTAGRRPWDVDAAGWPEGEIELRAHGNGRYLGRFMLTPGAGPVPPLQARLVAVTPADQTGAALDTAGPVTRG
ncbi:MAG: histidine kinase [Streptomyces sp.]|nr:histidine kinase [Streptomyces sp.]